MSRKTKLPARFDGPDHPDGFPVLCCFGSVPTLITNEAVARLFLKRIEEARQRLEKAIQVEREQKGGDA